MTDKQLEKLDIYPDKKGKLHPNRYWCNITQSYILLPRAISLKQVVEDIFQEGIKQGVGEGKKIRSQQFKDLIDGEKE